MGILRHAEVLGMATNFVNANREPNASSSSEDSAKKAEKGNRKMDIHQLPRTFSPMAIIVLHNHKKLSLSLRKLRFYVEKISVGTCILAFFCGNAGAFTQVTISTAAPAGLEEQFLSATTAQWLGTVKKNPLASHTYSLILYGPNPAYKAPSLTLEQALSLGSTIYVYGFGDGQSYNQHVERNLVESFSLNCSTPLPNVSAWDSETCHAVIGAIDAAIYEQSLSTPTAIPPGGF